MAKIFAFCMMIMCVWVAPISANQTWTVSGTEWAQPRSGKMIASLPGVHAAMRAISQSPLSHLAIHHPGGDRGIWWGEELKGWLVTLGLSSSRIELVPGGSKADMMYLSLIESQRVKSEE